MPLFRKKNTTPPTPDVLTRIKYVRVNYTSKRNMKESGILEYEGSVSWAAYLNCWEIFIDSCTFTDDYTYKDSICFLDSNKNVISMQGFGFDTEDVVAGDCGRVKIYKTA